MSVNPIGSVNSKNRNLYVYLWRTSLLVVSYGGEEINPYD